MPALGNHCGIDDLFVRTKRRKKTHTIIAKNETIVRRNGEFIPSGIPIPGMCTDILTNLGLVKWEYPRVHDVHESLPQRVGIVPPPVRQCHPAIGCRGQDLIEHGMIPTAGQAEKGPGWGGDGGCHSKCNNDDDEWRAGENEGKKE